MNRTPPTCDRRFMLVAAFLLTRRSADFDRAEPAGSRPLAEPGDISDAVVWLASDLSRTVTGTQLTLDMGATKV